MANTIIPKRSSVVGKVPLSTDLEVGELAVNLADGLIFSKNAAGTVISLGGGTSSGSYLPLTGGTLTGNDDILTLTSTDATKRTTIKLNTDGNDWEFGARGSTSGSYPNSLYVYDNAASAFRLVIDSTGVLNVLNNIQVSNGTDSRLNLQVSGVTEGILTASAANVQLSSANAIPITIGTNGVTRMTLTGTGFITTGASEYVGIGQQAGTNNGLRVARNLENGTSAYGVVSDGTFQSGVTAVGSQFRSVARTDATAFTLAALNHFQAVQATLGAGSAITTQSGFVADASMIGATNNYGFHGNIPSGTGRYNLYMAGTAANYLAGALQVDGGITGDLTGNVTGNVSGTAATITGIYSGPVSSPAVRSALGLSSFAALTVPVANASNTLSALSVAAGESIRVNAGGTAWEAFTPDGSGGSGTVTSVALSMPSIFTTTGSPVTSSGTLTATLANQTANTVFAAPNGSTGAPTFRALVAADIPALTLENIPDAWVKKSVRVATTANITLSGTQTIDGVALAVGDRVLVKNQTTSSANGIYVVASTAWSRAADANVSSELAAAAVGVDSGTVNGGLSFDCDFKSTNTLGTTAMSWGKLLDTNAANIDYVAPSGAATLTNKNISAYVNTIDGFPGLSFAMTNSQGQLDTTFAAKTIPGGVVVGTTDLQTLSNKTLVAAKLNDGYTEEVLAITGTAPALTPTTASIQTWALTANSTPTAGTWAAGQSLTLLIDDGTARTISWASLAVTWKTNGGSAPTLNLTGYTVIHLWKVGTVIYGARVGDA